PGHAMEKAAAIDSVVFVIVRNVIGHNFLFRLIDWYLFYICPYRSGSRLFPKILEGYERASKYLQKRRAQVSACSAAFEIAKYGQSPTSLSAASAARANEWMNVKNAGICPLNSSSAMKLLITPRASNCPGPVGRMIEHAGRCGLMNSHGSGMIKLACNVSG